MLSLGCGHIASDHLACDHFTGITVLLSQGCRDDQMKARIIARVQVFHDCSRDQDLRADTVL